MKALAMFSTHSPDVFSRGRAGVVKQAHDIKSEVQSQGTKIPWCVCVLGRIQAKLTIRVTGTEQDEIYPENATRKPTLVQ